MTIKCPFLNQSIKNSVSERKVSNLLQCALGCLDPSLKQEVMKAEVLSGMLVTQLPFCIHPCHDLYG
jgi:hypothetical protein